MFGGYPAIPLDLPQKVGSSKFFPKFGMTSLQEI